jgi:DNA methyltransferase 1-associated protein 1
MTSHDVRDMLDLPGSTGPRPAKKQRIAPPKHKLLGLAREVQALAGDTPISIVPEISTFKKKRLANRKPVAKWELKKFKNSARGDNLLLAHWRRQAEAPPVNVNVEEGAGEPMNGVQMEVEESTFAKYNVQVKIDEYTDEQYASKLEDANWSKDETDYLMKVIKEYDLRWPVIWDRYDFQPLVPAAAPDAVITFPKARSMEDLKARYYFIQRQMLLLHTPKDQMVQSQMDLHDLLRDFDPNQESIRKKFAENAFSRTKRILARAERVSEERKQLYATLEAPASTSQMGVYTTSAGLQQLLQQLMSQNNSQKRRSLKGNEGISPAGPSGMQQHGSFDRRDSNLNSSVSGPSRKGTLQSGQPERRELTKEEEKMYGVSVPTEKLSGPSFRAERLGKPITNKSATQQAKITNVLTELEIPSRLIMPTVSTGVEWENLLGGIMRLLELKKTAEKLDGDIALAKAIKAEQERKERGESEIKEEERSVRGGSVARAQSVQRKRSASVMSTVSDKSTKRQKK